MSECVTVKSSVLFALIDELFKQDKHVTIAACGTSMYPFIRDGIDSIELRRGRYEEITRGDIALVLRKSGEYVLHRVIRKSADEFYIIGDNQNWIEGPLVPEQFIAVATSIFRKHRKIHCGSLLWRFMSHIWLGLIPYRGKINRVLSLAGF